VCCNPGHFLNKYLSVTKSSAARNRAMPSISTCRALQRMATTFMSSFLFSGFKNASPSQKIQKLEIYGIVNVLFTEMKKEGNAFFALGYDIGLRHWIGETNKGSFELHNPTPKPRSAKHQPVQSQEIAQEMDQESSHEEFPTTLNNWDTRFTALFLQHNFLVARYNEMVNRMDKLERAFNNRGGATRDSIPRAAEEVNALVARMPQTVDLFKSTGKFFF